MPLGSFIFVLFFTEIKKGEAETPPLIYLILTLKQIKMNQPSQSHEESQPILIDEKGRKYIPVSLEEIQDEKTGRTIKPESERVAKLYTP